MATVWRKGSGFNAEYSSTDFPVLSDDWTGTAELFAANATIATDSWALVRVGNIMTLSVSPTEINNLDEGVYTLKSSFINTVLGVTVSSLEYVTVTAFVTSDQPMTMLTMTIAKIDGTPTGYGTETLVNTVDGAVVMQRWKGVKVTASHTTAYNIGTDIIGTETITTETNAAGYAQLAVIKGSTVTVACPSFGKTVTVDTTGHDTIDLSTFF